MHRGKRAKLVEFQDLVEASSNFKKYNVLELVEEILKNDLYSDKVKQECLKRVSEVQESEAEL